MSEDKLELLFNKILYKTLEEVYIEEDTFVMIFSNGTLVELYSSDGDLDLYYELSPEEFPLH